MRCGWTVDGGSWKWTMNDDSGAGPCRGGRESPSCDQAARETSRRGSSSWYRPAVPRPSVRYDPIAERYEHSRGGRPRAEGLAGALAEWLPPGGLVLDIGTGTGVVAACLSERGYKMVGLDVSLAMLRQAVPRLPGRAVLADAQLLPFRSRAASSATFCWSLHHVGDPGEALAEAARVVGSGGRVVAVSGRSEAPPDDIDAAMARLDPERADASWQSEMIEREAAGAGLRLLGQSWAEQWVGQSPADVAAQVARREFAPLWRLDNDGWARVAQPVIAELMSLPRPEQPRQRLHRHRVMAFSVP